ncbi:MAG: NUDIX domain-containing protein [Actinomycetes bacterium]
MDPVRRRSARVLVIDGADRVLLMRGGDPARPQHVIWHAPGGGVDHDEDDVSAARRELREETGLTLAEPDALVGPVWFRRLLFSFDGVAYDQDEVFYVVHVDSHEVDTTGHTDLERRSLTGHRWWTLPELRECADLVAPPDIADRLDELVRLGPPSDPVWVEGAVLP